MNQQVYEYEELEKLIQSKGYEVLTRYVEGEINSMRKEVEDKAISRIGPKSYLSGKINGLKYINKKIKSIISLGKEVKQSKED